MAALKLINTLDPYDKKIAAFILVYLLEVRVTRTTRSVTYPVTVDRNLEMLSIMLAFKRKKKRNAFKGIPYKFTILKGHIYC